MATTKMFYIKRREGGKEPVPEPEEEEVTPEPFMSIETMIQEGKFVKRKVFIENNTKLGTDKIEINPASGDDGGVGFRNIIESEGIAFFTYTPRAPASSPFGDVFVRGVNGAKGLLRQNVLLNAIMNDASENNITPFKKPLGFKKIFPDKCISFASDPTDYQIIDGEGDTVVDLSSTYFKDVYVLTYQITNKSLVEVTYTHDEGYETILEGKYFSVDSRGFGSFPVDDPETGARVYLNYHSYVGEYLKYVTNNTTSVPTSYWDNYSNDPFMNGMYKILRTFTLGFLNTFYEPRVSNGGYSLNRSAAGGTGNGDDHREQLSLLDGNLQSILTNSEINNVTRTTFNSLISRMFYLAGSNVYGDPGGTIINPTEYYNATINTFMGQRLNIIKIKNTAKNKIFPNEYNYPRGFANNINLHNRVGTLKFSVFNTLPSVFPDGPQISSYLIIPPTDYVAIGSAVTYPNFGISTLEVDDYACVHKDYISHYNSYYNQYISYRSIPDTYNGKRVNKLRDNESYIYHNRNIILYESVDRYFLPHKIKKMIEFSDADSQLNIYLGGNLSAYHPPSQTDSNFSNVKASNDPYYNYYGNYSSPIMIPIIDTTKIKLTNDIYIGSHISDIEPSNFPPLHIVSVSSNDVESVIHTRELNDAPVSSSKRLWTKVGLAVLSAAVAIVISLASAGIGSLASSAAATLLSTTAVAGALSAVGKAVEDVTTKAFKETLATGLKTVGKEVTGQLKSLQKKALTSIAQTVVNPSDYFSVGKNDPGSPCCKDVIICKLSSKYYYNYNNGEENRIYPFGDVIDVVNNIVDPPTVTWYGSSNSDEVEKHMLDYVARKYALFNKYHTKHAYMMPLIKNVTALPEGFELAWTFQENEEDLRHMPFIMTEQISDLSGSNLATNTLSNKTVPFFSQRNSDYGDFESQYRSILKVDSFDNTVSNIKDQKKGTSDAQNERTRTISVYRIIPPKGYVALGCAVVTAVNIDGYFSVPNKYDYICMKEEYCLPIKPVRIWDSMHVATKNLVGLFTTVEPYFIPGVNGTTDPTSISSPKYDYTLNTECLQIMEPIHGMYDTTKEIAPIYKRHLYLNVQDLRVPFDANDSRMSKNRNMMKNNLFREIKDFTRGNDIYYINFPTPHTIMLPVLLQDSTKQSFTFVYTGRNADFSRSNNIRRFVTDTSDNIPYLKLENNAYVTTDLDENENVDTNNSYPTATNDLRLINNYNIIMNFADADTTVTTSDISLNYYDIDLSSTIIATGVNSDTDALYSYFMNNFSYPLRNFIFNANFDYLDSGTPGSINPIVETELKNDPAHIVAVKMFMGYQYTARGFKMSCPTTNKMFDRYIMYVKKECINNKYTWLLNFYKITRLDTPLADMLLCNTYNSSSNSKIYTNKCAIDASGLYSCAIDYSNNFIINNVKTNTIDVSGNYGNVIYDVAMYDNTILFPLVGGDNTRNINLYKRNNLTWDLCANLLSGSNVTYFNDCVLKTDIYKNNVVISSPDVSGSRGGFKVFELSNNTLTLKTTVTNHVSGIGFANDVSISENYMAVGVRDFNIGEPMGITLSTINVGTPGVRGIVCWSNSDTYIATGDASWNIIFRNSSTGTITKVLSGHTSWVNSIDFSLDDRKLVSASRDGTFKLWDVSSGSIIYTLTGISGEAHWAKFSRDNRYIAGCGANQLKIWDVSSGQLVRTITDSFGSITAFDFSPDGSKIAASSYIRYNGSVYPPIHSHMFIAIWDSSSGNLLFRRDLNDGYNYNGPEFYSVEYSPDGKYVLIAIGITIYIWNSSSMSLYKTLVHPSGNYVNSASFSFDSKYVTSTCEDSLVRIWDISSSNVIYSYSHNSTYSKFNSTATRIASIKFSDIKLGDITWGSFPIFQKLGKAIVYKKDTSGNWNQWQTINAPDDLKNGFYNSNGSPKDPSSNIDFSGNTNLNFGFSVAITDNYLAVSAPPYGLLKGAVAVYKRNTTTNLYENPQIIYGPTETLSPLIETGLSSVITTNTIEAARQMAFGSQINISDTALYVLRPFNKRRLDVLSLNTYSKLFAYSNISGTWEKINEYSNVVSGMDYEDVTLRNGNYTTGSSIHFNKNYGVSSSDISVIGNTKYKLDYYSYENIYNP